MVVLTSAMRPQNALSGWSRHASAGLGRYHTIDIVRQARRPAEQHGVSLDFAGASALFV